MPAPFSDSPLFRHASRAIRQAAQSEFARSAIGQLVQAATKSRGRDSPQLRSALGTYSRRGSSAGLRQMFGADLGGLAREVLRYSKAGGADKRTLDAFLRSLGPTGNLLKAIADAIGQGGGSSADARRDLNLAANLVRAAGGEIMPGHSWGSMQDAARSLQAAIGYVERQPGYRVLKPGDEPAPRSAGTLPFGQPSQTRTGADRKFVTLPDGYGRTKRYAVTHPLITGEMVQTPQSSNVYAFGYDVEVGVLYVRFKDRIAPGQRDKNARDAVRSGGFTEESRPHKPGPIYAYEGVDQQEFLDMLRASSKGEWVWDHLRVRGTVSGHQKDYRLVGVQGGYVPRKATLKPDGEWFVGRKVMSDRNRWLKSNLADERAGVLASRGTPNNGRPKPPNRGRPNTGRP